VWPNQEIGRSENSRWIRSAAAVISSGNLFFEQLKIKINAVASSNK
jgi:hypothetical protein